MNIQITTYRHHAIQLLIAVCLRSEVSLASHKTDTNQALMRTRHKASLLPPNSGANDHTNKGDISHNHTNTHLAKSDAMLLAVAHISLPAAACQCKISHGENAASWLSKITVYNKSVLKRLSTATSVQYVDTTNAAFKNASKEWLPQPCLQVLQRTKQQLDEYFDGVRQTFELPLYTQYATAFEQMVWQVLMSVAYGDVISYAQLACRIGRPKAYRAVANANAKNAFSIVVPCHRVINKNGELGGYTGGIEKKKYLLELERRHTTKTPLKMAATKASPPSTIHVVLVHPNIPANTGNIIRLCANTGAILHVVEPLGFELDDKKLRRAGLDYHEYAQMQVHPNWQAAKRALKKASCTTMVGLTTKLSHSFYEYNFGTESIESSPCVALVFGSETRGLPEAVRADIGPSNWLRLPMRPDSRSLNLANSVAICLYEVWRQLDFAGDEGKSVGYDEPNHASPAKQT